MRKLVTLIALAVLWVAGANAGDFLPERGAAAAIGCDGADGLFGADSVGMGCEYAYWQPIGQVQYGGVTLTDDSATVNGVVCVPNECRGITDRFLVLSRSGDTAQVLLDGRFLAITLQETDTEIVIGSEQLGYLVHAAL